MNKKNRDRLIEFGILGASAGFAKGIDEVIAAGNNLAERLRSLDWWGWSVLCAVALIYLCYIRFTRFSRLMKVDALRIDPDKPAHLIGRADKISKLEELCRNSFLVNLVGESGAGKSALVRSGLVPSLVENEKLLPVYMDTWGQNWELGPATGLADAVWAALDDDSRQKLELTTRPEATQLVELLGRLESDLGRTPLLIFDQFDDYQARHRDKFLVEQTQTVLPTSQLIKENPFWSGINDLLRDRCVRCLFVTRADTAAGLESVRFIEPQVFPLERPQINIVEELLATLTATTKDEAGNDVEVIHDPEYGWQRLMGRVERDLNEDDQVLPVRLRLVLQGLSQLNKLTVSEYEKAGGYIGLEAGFIESKVRNATRDAGAVDVTEKQIRDLLLSLVDREKLKTVGKPASQLKVG
ncbi:MAG: nSTAND1 domain-containing NTPase [Planctomycetales bacterium]|jgi:hypothetical protein